MGNSQIKPAVFFDRDGVLTANVYYPKWKEWEGPLQPEDMQILPGAIEALQCLKKAQLPFFLFSNQGAYAKGKTSLENLIAVGRIFENTLAEHQLTFTESFYSYTHPQGIVPHFSGESLERKPGAYFLYIAAAKYGIDLSASWFVGDRDTDILCGQQAGLQTILVVNPEAGDTIGDSTPSHTVFSVTEAVTYILSYTDLN